MMTVTVRDTARSSGMDVVHQGLRYVRNPDAFLSLEESKYALEALWSRCAGAATWSGPPAVDVPALSRAEVVAGFDIPPGDMPWSCYRDLEPATSRLTFDTQRLPMLCAASTETCRYHDTARFPLDLVAATFLMLTRWEETNRPSQRTASGNYLASYSLAARQGFLDRPIIDEWALVLRGWLQARQPAWLAIPPRPRILMTHDIDHPYLYCKPKAIVRECGKELLRKRQPLLACRTLADGIRGYFAQDTDPYSRAVDALMDIDESLGTRGVFFFMSADNGPFDEGYDLGSTAVRRMLARIQERGHDVGWHPSYRAAEDQICFDRELQRYKDVLGATPQWVRHHYLRWKDSSSWRRLDDAGISVDSTLGFNEAVGFRCGTCLPFQTWDLHRGCRLKLVEQPLVAEDVAMFSYQNCDTREASRQIRQAWNRTRYVGGCLVALIHNSQSQDGLGRVLTSFRIGLQEANEMCAKPHTS